MKAPPDAADERIRVLHVATTSAGGLGTSLLAIMRALDPQRYRVDVALGLGYPLDSAFEPAGFRLHALRLGRGLHPLQFAGTVVRLTRLMRRERYRLVHVHGSEAGILGRWAARAAGVPSIVVELHGYANRDPDSILERTVYRWLERALDPMTAAYVAVSEHVRRQWSARRVCAPERIEVIHHALDLAAFPDRDPDRRVDLGLGPGPIVGTACLLEQRKGLIDWVEAMPEVRRQVPAVRFAIVGEGPLRPWMEQRAKQLGVAESVRFLGWRDDVPALMRSFDLFVLPSRRESFGLVFLEAMASGCPLVGTRVDGIPEVVEDGRTGALVPAGDPAALARAVVELLTDRVKAARFARSGRQRVEQAFGMQRMADAYNALYARVLDAVPAGSTGSPAAKGRARRP